MPFIFDFLTSKGFNQLKNSEANVGQLVISVPIYKCQNLQLPVQSVSITTNVVSSNPVHGEVYSIQHYVIKFVSNLGYVSGFLWYPSPIKLTATI
jgi:hypothetical protein